MIQQKKRNSVISAFQNERTSFHSRQHRKQMSHVEYRRNSSIDPEVPVHAPHPGVLDSAMGMLLARRTSRLEESFERFHGYQQENLHPQEARVEHSQYLEKANRIKFPKFLPIPCRSISNIEDDQAQTNFNHEEFKGEVEPD